MQVYQISYGELINSFVDPSLRLNHFAFASTKKAAMLLAEKCKDETKNDVSISPKIKLI
jgi:hypothetical protein